MAENGNRQLRFQRRARISALLSTAASTKITLAREARIESLHRRLGLHRMVARHARAVVREHTVMEPRLRHKEGQPMGTVQASRVLKLPGRELVPANCVQSVQKQLQNRVTRQPAIRHHPRCPARLRREESL
jgi:hypothetical protein